MSTTAQDTSTHNSMTAHQEGQNESYLPTSEIIPMSPESIPSPDPPPPPPPPSAKDSGYAWVVVAVVFWVNTLCAGYIKSFGITYLLLLEYFPDASGAAAGWIMGLLIGTRGLLSPLMGAMSVKLGVRRTVLAGTFLTAFGLLLAIPSFSIYYMAVTLGGIVGIGLSMSETPGILLVTEYFVEKRALANAIRAAGNPMGGILFSPLVVFLNDQFGLQGSFMMLAGIMLHMAILAMLMRSVEMQEQILHHQHLRKIQAMPENMENGGENTRAIKAKAPKKKAMDLTLFKNPLFLVYILMGLCVNLALPNFLLYIPAYGRSVGLTNYQTSIIVSYLSFADCILRVLCGYLVQKLHLDEACFFIVGLLIGGVGCLLVPLCSNMWTVMLASSLYGFGLATFWALLTNLLTIHFGVESMASSWGFFRMVQGITSFIYPSFHGLMVDLTGSLVVSFLIMGGGFILGGIVFSLPILIGKISKARNG